jgi:hypothetical protein
MPEMVGRGPLMMDLALLLIVMETVLVLIATSLPPPAY